jgi:hypothetical protein
MKRYLYAERVTTTGSGAGMTHAGIKPDRPEWVIPAPEPTSATNET